MKKHWDNFYLPPDELIWREDSDFPDNSCFFQRIKVSNLLISEPFHTAALTFALLGFKCDEGANRDGTRLGANEAPVAIRKRLAKLPLQKSIIDMYDVGDVVCKNHQLEESQEVLAEIVASLLKKNIRPIIIGGGHEVSWGHYQGIVKAIDENKRLGIINFDAHFDLKPAKNKSSAMTAFYQIASAERKIKHQLDLNCIGIQHAGNTRQLFETAKKYKAKIILADELHQGLQEKCVDFVDRIVDENDVIYTSLSMDVFSPAFAPGVSSIQPLGLDPWHIIPFLRQVAASGKVISYDIAEHVPRYDIDHRTAKLAATLIYEIVHHHLEIHTHSA